MYTGDGVHFGIRTTFGYYLTAVNSGGLTTATTPDVMRSDAAQNLLNWEKFSFAPQGEFPPRPSRALRHATGTT